MSLSALSHWRNRGPIDTTPKKLRMGLVPSGTNNYTWPSFFYDEAKRAWWTLASSNGPPIYPLDFPYAYDPSTVFPNGFSAPKGWNTTLDGSTVNSSELGLAVAPVERASIKMDNDGWIDLSTLPSGTTRICLILPGVFSKARAGNTFQVRFASPVLSAVLDGTGAVANSWQSEDGNAGYNYRFTLAGQSAALSIRIEVANVPGGKIKRPKIVPHPGGNGVTRSPNAYTPEPVGEPQELGRIMHACRHIRTLDMMRINGRKISGDSFTALRLRDTEPTDYLFGSDTNGLDHPCCSMAEMVAIANENNAGLHVNFGHRDSDALLQQHAATLAGLNGELIVEHSNEAWNTAFRQNSEITVLGLRAGLGALSIAKSSQASPQTMLWPNSHVNTETVIDHHAGDLVIFNGTNIGLLVFRARTFIPAGTKLPIVQAATTNKIYKLGECFFTNNSRTMYCANQDNIPAGTSRSDPAFTHFDNSTPDATAVAAGCVWDLIAFPFEAHVAQYNYRSWMTRKIADWCDAARSAVGKSKCTPIINFQASSTQFRYDGSTSSTEPAIMLVFDDLWRRPGGVHALESVYLGESTFSASKPENMLYFGYRGTTPGTDWDQQARYDVYRTDITAEQAVSNALDKMLSTASRAKLVNDIKARLYFQQGDAANNPSYNFQKFLNDRITSHNNDPANAGDQIAPNSIEAWIGVYEAGAAGTNSGLGAPDEAGNWSSTATYVPGYLATNFVYYTRSNVKKLWRCKGTPTVGTAPPDDLANWEEITKATDPFTGDIVSRWSALFNGFWRHPNMKLLMDELWVGLRDHAITHQSGNGIFNAYSSLRLEVGVTTITGINYGMRWWEDEDAGHSPAWASLIQTKTEWDALP